MSANPGFSESSPDPGDTDDAPALVVVVQRPADLQRAKEEGWYRIPLNRAPSRVAAEHLAFYQTGAFPPGERFMVRWMAPVRGYSLATRRELIPEEPKHSRADEYYYKVLLGNVVPLPHSIPSRRLRRITFIPTTFNLLLQAEEINDLWIRSRAQELLWEALRQAGLECENQYPIEDDFPAYVADMVLFCNSGRIAVIIAESRSTVGHLGESREVVANFLANAGNWHLLTIAASEVENDTAGCVKQLAKLVDKLGGLVSAPNEESLHA
jgi:hypothetical protein